MRKFIIAMIGIVLWCAGLWVAHEVFPSARRAFGKYVCSPIPKTVQDVRFQGNDGFLAFECQCFLTFSASSNDLRRIVDLAGLQRVKAGDMLIHSFAPPWFVVPQNAPLAQCFIRFFGNGHGGGGKYLWIDATGTNAYFQYVETD